MSEKKSDSKSWILFGDGTIAKIRYAPQRYINDNGIPIIRLYLHLTEELKRKHQIKDYELVDDSGDNIIVEEYTEATLMPQGQGHGTNPIFLELKKQFLEILQSKDVAFKKSKETIKKILELMKLGGFATGVISMDEDPNADFRYFCFSDLKHNETKSSLFFSRLIDLNEMLREKVKRLDAMNRMQRDEIRKSQENYRKYADYVGKIVETTSKGKIVVVKEGDKNKSSD